MVISSTFDPTVEKFVSLILNILQREVKAIMSIATTVCLPWLVALLMTGPPTMAQIFQWIFIIVTSMQGPTMFICFVIFQEDVLTNLFSLIGKEPPQALLPAKSSKSTKSAASEISSIKPTTAAPVKKVRQLKNLVLVAMGTLEAGFEIVDI